MAGLSVSLLSVCVVPALGALGFGALGPVGGTAATAWHSSIGLASSGSLFSWCQGVAMGGAALGSVQAAGAAGLAAAGVGSIPELMKTFKRGFRTPSEL